MLLSTETNSVVSFRAMELGIHDLVSEFEDKLKGYCQD